MEVPERIEERALTVICRYALRGRDPDFAQPEVVLGLHEDDAVALTGHDPEVPGRIRARLPAAPRAALRVGDETVTTCGTCSVSSQWARADQWLTAAGCTREVPTVNGCARGASVARSTGA